MKALYVLLTALALLLAGGLHADSWTEGGKRILVLDCGYADTGPSGTTTQQVNDLFKIGQTGGLDEWLRRDSFGRAWYSEVVHVKVTLPGNKSDYSGAGFAAYRDGMATAGLSSGDYDRIMTLAAGTVTGSTAYAFVRGTRSHYNGLPNKIIGHHELHHNMGLNHAQRWETSTDPRQEGGSDVEYGDGDDILGGGGAHINAQYKFRLEYLKEANGEVAMGTNGNTYRIFDHTHDDLTPAGTELRAVRIPIEGSNFNGDRQLWVSYTHTLGDEEMRGGVQIHASRQARSSYSHRLDMSPGDHLSSDSSGAKEDIRSAELAIGKTYTDTEIASDYSHPGAISITPIAKGSTSGVNWIDVVVHSESVGANSAPTGGAISGAASANAGQSIALTASATDPNGDTLAYFWDFGDGTFSTDSAALQNKSWSSPGYYLVDVTISDRRGGVTTVQHWVNVGGQASRTPENDATTGDLFYEYYEGIFTVLPNFDQLLPDSTGTIAAVGIPLAARGDDFAVRITGYLDVPATDVYRFVLRSEDGSRLFIGDTLVVNNTGERNSPEEVEGNIALNAGQHAITVEMRHRSGAETLELSWATMGQTPTEILSGSLAGHDWQSNTVPTVSITTPSNGGAVDFGTTPTFTASASDADGIATVQFYLNGTFLGEDTSSPFELPWEASFAGTFDLTARAVDATGRTANTTHSFSVTTPDANQVAINFVGSDSYNYNVTWPLNAGESAGAVYLNDHWNNFTHETLRTGASLTDQTGAPATVRVAQWSGLTSSAAPNYPLPQFRSQANTSTANGKLFKGLNWRRFDQDEGTAPFVTFDRIPYQEYEVYVYFDYDETGGDVNSGGTERPADTTVQEFILSSLDANAPSPDPIFGKSSLSLNDGEGDWPTYDTWTNFKEATAATNSAPSSELLGNYVVFRGQYAHSFKLLVDSGGDRYVNGLQIVEVDPTIPRLHIVGGAETLTSSESGSPFSYEAVLTIEPTSPVAVSIEAPESLELDTYLLYFTASNWNIPQTVTIYPQDNNTVDGNRALSIVHNPSGGNYSAAPVTTLPVTLTDDETAFVTATAVASVITETGGGSVDFRVIRQGGDLSSSLTVDFTLSGAAANDGSDYTLSGTGVTHNTGSGTGSVIIAADEAFATVTLTAINDASSEGIEDATLTVGTGSGFAAGDPASATINISDTGSGGEFTEAFAGGAFDLEGKSITFTPDGSGAFYSAEVTSTASFHATTSGHTEYATSDQDDSAYAVNVSANPVPFFGVSYSNYIFVGTNGYITFGTSDSQHVDSFTNHFNLPRISMYFGDMRVDWDDADPSSVKVGRTGTGSDARTVVTVLELEEYGSSLSVDYQVELFDDGRLRLTWLNISADDPCIVGLSGGVGGSSGFSSADLSALTPTSGPTNSAPVFGSTPTTGAITGEAYSLSVMTDDFDGDSLTLTAPTKPAWLTLTGTGNGTATLSGTPSSAGSYPVVLEVTDGTASPVQQSFTIQVNEALVNTVPSIIEQPVSQSVGYNEEVSFRVVATGTPTLTYQWFFGDLQIIDDGSHYSGATTAQLSITDVVNAAGSNETNPNGDEGDYYCVVTNAYGEATSSNATLTVGDPTAPSIDTQPASQTINAGSTAVLSAAVSGTTPFTYQWQADTGTGWQNLTNGGDISGATTLSLSIANFAAADEGDYRLLVSNPAASDVATNAAALAINLSPQVVVDSPVGSAANLVNLTDRLVLETTITDEGTPTISWTQVSGPGTATFEDAAAEDTTVTFDATGSYVLRITVDDGLATDSADVTVGVDVTAGAEQLVRYNFGSTNTDVSPSTVSAQVNVTDITLHGLSQESQSNVLALTGANTSLADYIKFTITPSSSGSSMDMNGGTVSYSWQRMHKDGATRTDLISNGTTVSLPVQNGTGSGTSNYSEAISGLPISESIEVRIYFQAADSWNDIDVDNLIVNGALVLNTAPVPNAGADAAAVTSVATSLSGSATDDGNPNPPAAISYQWSQLSGPGAASFGNATSPTSNVTFSASGTYALRLIAGDGAVKTADDVTYTVSGTATIPDAPSALSASATSSSQIDLTWTDNSNNESGFKIERSTTGGGVDFTLLTTTDPNATSYSDTGLSQTTTYYYRVASTNVAGDSAFTSETSDTTTSPQPGTVAMDSATYSVDESDGTVTLTATRSSGVDGAASVDFATSNGNATAGSDYTANSGTLNWTDGEGGSKNIVVAITDDSTEESAETFTVTLSNVASASLGTPTSATVTIQANDSLTLPPTSGLVLYYPFEEGSGTSTSDDAGSNNGTLNNSIQWTTGQLGNALDFDLSGGTDVFEDVTTGSAVNVTASSSWSAAAWIYVDTTPSAGNRIILQQNDASGGTGRSWLAVTETMTLFSYLGGAGTESAATLSTGQWHHVALTAGSGTVTLYLDGTSVASGSLSVEAANGIFHIGNHKNPDDGKQWDGKIDEFRLYNRVLTAQELADTAAYLPAGTPTAPSGLTATTLSTSEIDLAWIDNSGDETGFKIERSTSSGTGFSLIHTTAADATSYSDTGLTANTTYYYRISATNAEGDSSATSEASDTTLVAPAPGTLQLTTSAWNAGEGDGTVTITAERISGSSGAVSIGYATSNGTATAGSDYTAASGTLNWADGDTANKTFAVTIVNDGTYTGDRSFTVALSTPGGSATLGSPATATVTITEDEAVPPPPAGAPTWVSVDPASASSMIITWDDNTADETGFDIERATSSGGPWASVQSPAADADVWTDTGLSASTEYFYRVSVTGGADAGATSSVVSATTLSGSNDLIRMRQNALNLMRAIGASRTSSYMTASLATLSTDAQSALDTIQVNGSWTDVDYTDVVPDDTWSLDLHYNRLQDMARAWATPGTTLYQDAATLTAILNGIDYIETIVNNSTNRNNGNWWWWNIGIPQRYAPTLLLVREELGSTRLNQATATLDYLIGNTLLDGTEGAQNWIWQGMNRIHHGLIDSNTADLTEGAGYVSTYVVMATPGVDNGIMPDYAFQAHGATVSTGYRSQLATGQYGASFMKDVPKFTFFAEGTGYQLSAAKQQILADFALKGSRWTVFGQFSDISVEGRAYTRDNRSAANPLSGLMALANTPGSPAQSVAAASAKRILQDWTFDFSPEDAGLAALVSEMPETAAQPTGFREYNYSDYAVARQDNWMISLKAISDRMLIGEDINGENLKGRHLSSGVTWIYTGDEYRLNNVIPTLDHDRIPGTTIEKGLNLNDEYHYTPGLRSFVGSASTGTGGASAMNFHSQANFPSESDLEAKKSWFFFGDSMVAVGSGITGTVSNKTVETIVNQRPMGTINDDITVDGAVQSTATGTTTHTGIGWAHEGDLGYVFPGGADVNIKRATQSGSWSGIGSGSTTTYSNPMVSLWFDHGTTPTNADYAYAVLPNATSAETQTVAGNNTFEVLENSTALHAVKHHGENAVGAVFWQAGQIDRVSVDTPSVVFWDINGSTLELALSEPDHSSATIELTFAGDLTPVSLPTGVSSAVSNGSTVITYTVANGQNYDATFTINSLGSLPALAPTISPTGGLVSDPVDVTIGHPDGSATIRYTTDGTDPDGTSPIYSAGFQVTSTTTVKAIAQVSGQGDSTITSQTFSFVDASFFINAGEGGYTTDGSNTWQEIDLSSGTGSGGGNNGDAVTITAFTLADSSNSTARGITLAVTPTGIASGTAVLNEATSASDFTGNPFGWFDPADADQHETFAFSGSSGSQYWTYTFDGFDPGDTVSFQFVVRRESASNTRLTTLSGGAAGGSLTALYTDEETDETPQFVTMELTGSSSYEFRLANTSATAQWCPVPNAIAVFVSEDVTASAPDAASGLSATAASSTQINLSWTDNSGDETGFKIQRSTTSGSGFSTIATAAANATSYSDTGRTAGTEYFYQVIATNASGDSAPTTEASATTWTASESWRDQYFSQTGNSGDAANNNDFDNDGVPNLLERAFGTNPTVTGSVALPSGGVADDSGSDYLMITYRRLTGGTGTTGVDYTVDGMTYTVEYDDDLTPPWSSGAVTQVGTASGNDDGTETVTVRLNAGVSGVNHQFIRIKVTEAP